MKLGAGRATEDDIIDPTAGIVLNKKVGDYVSKDETLCTFYTNKKDFHEYLNEIVEAFKLSKDKVEVGPVIYEIVQ